jgi:hypothetical protein
MFGIDKNPAAARVLFAENLLGPLFATFEECAARFGAKV